MNIISFLLDNIFIVVIVAGFLMSLIGKAGGQKKPPNRMPSFGGNEDRPRPQVKPQSSSSGHPMTELQRLEQHRLEQQQLEQKQLEQRRAAEARQHALQLERQAEYEERQRQQLERRLAAAEAKQKDLSQHAAASFGDDLSKGTLRRPKRSSGSSKRVFNSSHAGADELRKAVVWAEILGPPRAKRRYR